jgi:hypothetical protein
MTLLRRLRKLLNPPRRYYRCGPSWPLPGCGKVISVRWWPWVMDLHQGGLFGLGDFCGEWRAISAASASAQRHRLGGI